MPIYEYICEACGSVFERLVFSSDKDGPVECPSCHKMKTRRQLSSFSCGAGDQVSGSPFSSGCSAGGGFS
jgi:putative FmdB family regulatory protein